MLVESPPRQADDGEQWMPVSDLMAVLMLIFIFIAVIFIRDVWSGEESARIECDKIYNALNDRFADDFEKWDVEFLKKDLTIRFRNPEILFESDKDKIRPRFERVLGDFFPSYIETVRPIKPTLSSFESTATLRANTKAQSTRPTLTLRICVFRKIAPAPFCAMFWDCPASRRIRIGCALTSPQTAGLRAV